MKVTDLMVGDWVSYCGFYNKVIYIGQKVSMYDGKGTEFTTDPEHIRPIPLTEEILVKNRFHTYGESYFIPEDKCNAHIRIGFHYRETVVDLHLHGAFSIQISYKPGMLYVHTLQHLLRERGIDKEIEL